MKKGDIVIMPGQSTSVEPASVGILVSSENDGKRVLVLTGAHIDKVQGSS